MQSWCTKDWTCLKWVDLQQILIKPLEETGRKKWGCKGIPECLCKEGGLWPSWIRLNLVHELWIRDLKRHIYLRFVFCGWLPRENLLRLLMHAVFAFREGNSGYFQSLMLTSSNVILGDNGMNFHLWSLQLIMKWELEWLFCLIIKQLMFFNMLKEVSEVRSVIPAGSWCTSWKGKSQCNVNISLSQLLSNGGIFKRILLTNCFPLLLRVMGEKLEVGLPWYILVSNAAN